MPGDIAYNSLPIDSRSKFRFSFASLFKAQLDRLSYNFRMIKFWFSIAECLLLLTLLLLVLWIWCHGHFRIQCCSIPFISFSGKQYYQTNLCFELFILYVCMYVWLTWDRSVSDKLTWHLPCYYHAMPCMLISLMEWKAKFLPLPPGRTLVNFFLDWTGMALHVHSQCSFHFIFINHTIYSFSCQIKYTQ